MSSGTFEKTIAGEDAMVAFGGRIGSVMSRGATVFLSGDLGAGKTTLCRGVLQLLGHNGPVKSPTYTLVEPYVLSDQTVYHFDLYRLADPEELEYIGIRDYFETQGFETGSFGMTRFALDGSGKDRCQARPLCLVEWPERGQGYLPEPDISIRISIHGEGRLVVCEAGTEYGLEIIELLKKNPEE